MKPNMACGVCISLNHAFNEGARKRRDIAKGAFKKRGVAPTKQSTHRAALRCARDHAWWSTTLKGKDDAVEQPQCEVCKGYFVTMNVVKGTLDPSIPCGETCANARTFVCKCSCAGSVHGSNALVSVSV
jgi:hypothetical protein